MEFIGLAMMAGAVVGSGISAGNTVKAACDNAKQAKDLLVANRDLQKNWSDIFTKQDMLFDTIISEIHDLNANVIRIQNKIKKNMDTLQKTKKTILILGFCMIIGIFFSLVIKYFLKQLAVATG